MSFINLPPEILLLIGEHLKLGKDILSLILTSRRLSLIFPCFLHPLAIQPCEGLAPLQWAASNNHCGLIRLLLSKDFSVDSQPLYRSYLPYSTAQRHRGTALHRAVMFGHLDAARLLLEHNASPNITDNVIGETPLHVAAYLGNAQMLSLLLKMGADHALKSRTGSTALHIAVSSRNESAVLALLQAGADPATNDGFERTTLHIAFFNFLSSTCIKIIKHIIASGARVDGGVLHAGKTALYIAAVSGHDDLVALVLKHGGAVTDLCEDGKTALHGAVTPCVIRMLLEAGSDIAAEDNEGSTALDLAVYNSRQGDRNYEPRILLLLEEGRRRYTNKTLHSVLVWVVEKDRADILAQLFEHGIDLTVLNKYNNTALHIAVLGKKIGMVKMILAKGVDIDIRDWRGATALHFAVAKAKAMSLEMTRFLLERGAEVNAVNERGSTVLDMALKHVKSEWRDKMVRMLKDNGARCGECTMDDSSDMDVSQK